MRKLFTIIVSTEEVVTNVLTYWSQEEAEEMLEMFRELMIVDGIYDESISSKWFAASENCDMTYQLVESEIEMKGE